MAQDIRELFKNDKDHRPEGLPEGHHKRLLDRLEQELPQRKTTDRHSIYKWAAVFVVALGITAFFIFSDPPVEAGNGIVEVEQEEKKSVDVVEQEKSRPTLADISPEFKKVEAYYLANLNLGLSKLDITEENKSLVDSFMAQLAELDKEYGRLNNELQEHGLSEDTIGALIQNLQLRLDLLYKLNSKLNELKQEKNENYTQHQA